MSQENLQRVHEQYDRYNAGERVPGRWFWHEEAEYHTAREDPDHAAHVGIDAIAKLFASWLEAYPDLQLEIQESEARDDKVFLWILFTGHGAASGIPLQMELAHVLTLRDGRALSVVEYSDREEARAVVGLIAGATAENEAVATRAIEAFNAVDVPAFAACTTPDFEWSPSMVAVDGTTFHGRAGIESYFASLEHSWKSFQIRPERFRSTGEVVVMLGRLQAEGLGSGVPVDSPLGMTFDFRAGEIARIRGFLSHEEALRAAGRPSAQRG